MKRSAIPENSDVSTSSSNKTFLIVAITIGALIVLGLLLFFGKQFVGKAIATTTVTTLTQGSTASIPITVQMGTSQARSYYFELVVTGVSLCSGTNLASGVSISSGYASGFNPRARCNAANGVLTFQDSFVPPMNDLAAPGPTAEVTLATISFTVPTINQITFHFNTLEVTNENGAQVISGQSDIVLPVTSGEIMAPFSLTSSAFANSVLSTRYTCGGASMSPPLTIQNIPASTTSLTLIMDDLDASNTASNKLTHWLMFNIPRGTATEITIPESSSPWIVGTNDLDVLGYSAPCPDMSATHNYRVRVYALDSSFSISTSPENEGDPDPIIKKEDLLSAMGISDEATSAAGHVLGIAMLSGAYTRTAVAGRCGDGNIDVNLAEQCDGTNLNEETCLSKGFGGGALSCFPSSQSNRCTFDTSACTTICGNGVREGSEQCDDGNTANGDGCSSTCTTEVECPASGICSSVEDLFARLTQDQRITLCTANGITATTCPGTPTFNANINGDDVIDDRDALFIFQAIEAKQSVYNYCGAANQPPCVFDDRAICEDVSYVWTEDTRITNPPALPTSATSTQLNTAGIICGSLEANSE